MSKLFTPIRLREVEARNRVFVSPMCQYSCVDGRPTDWHLVHLGSRAVGGAGLVMVEATAVSPEGRISPGDTGIWSDDLRDAFRPIAAFVREHGAVPAMQIAHAGRKASTDVPWRGGRVILERDGGWRPLAPSAVPFRDGDPEPHALSRDEIRRVVDEFAAAAARARAAGFEAVEIHMAHGYLIHEFLSPLSNRRDDEYGGAFDARVRMALETAAAVREAFPSDLPVFARVSATDWVEGGWDLAQTVELARRLGAIGVDLVDCSSGGAVPGARITTGPGYQVPFAEAIRREAGVLTGAVGEIADARQAEQVLVTGQADVVFLARAMLRDPYWAMHAARELGVDAAWPVQYQRAVN
jgi:2,4-dienoyl-CoA reductase-like NADH-dependent reductase (Old Yellow Enzyme family)